VEEWIGRQLSSAGVTIPLTTIVIGLNLDNNHNPRAAAEPNKAVTTTAIKTPMSGPTKRPEAPWSGWPFHVTVLKPNIAKTPKIIPRGSIETSRPMNQSL
jgi:hypothetical protein